MESYLIEEVVKATAQQHPRQTDSDPWGLQLEQTFVSTVSAAEHGWSWTHREHEIEEGGRSTALTKANVERFIQRKIQHRFEDSCLVQIDAARQGLNVFFSSACVARGGGRMDHLLPALSDVSNIQGNCPWQGFRWSLS